jgi:hypothetical protein
MVEAKKTAVGLNDAAWSETLNMLSGTVQGIEPMTGILFLQLCKKAARHRSGEGQISNDPFFCAST